MRKYTRLIISAFKKQKEALLVVGGLAAGYILFSALVVINIEQETLPTFFGIAIVAYPAGIVTAGYMDEINQIRKDKETKDGMEFQEK